MQLTALIREDLITVNLEARDKWEAIEELIDLLISRHELRLSDRDEVVDAVVAREKSVSTGLEHGVAIPHGVVGCITDPLSAMGVCKAGVPFDAIDGQRIKLVILLLIPEGAFQQHVRTLAGIARLGTSLELRNRIFQAQTSADVMAALRQADYENE